MRQIEDCPELNLSNYDADDVSRLNDWAVRADAEVDRLQEALREIALAGMSGTGMESEEGMRDWHARQAWKFIGIAARALSPDGVTTVPFGPDIPLPHPDIVAMDRERNAGVTEVHRG